MIPPLTPAEIDAALERANEERPLTLTDCLIDAVAIVAILIIWAAVSYAIWRL